MKKILLTSTVVVAMILASCEKDGGNNPNPIPQDTDVAYVSIRIDNQPGSRASTEEESSTEESAIKSLYLITFTETGNVVAVPEPVGGFSNEILGTSLTPAAVKVSAASKNLVVIANPGPKLKSAITSLNAQSTFATFNAAITGATVEDIVGSTAVGFAMITSGDETGKNVNDKILNPFVVIGNKLKIVTSANPDPTAQTAAQTDPLTVKLERYAAKLVVKTAGEDVDVYNDDQFALTGWTLDAVNGSYYPFAEKTLTAGHTGTSYSKAFYTKDPNFTNSTGIVHGTVNANFQQVLPWSNYYGWRTPETGHAYVTENTMDAAYQSFANATRIVLKATYSPNGYNSGADWFSYGGVTYETLDDLKAAYADENAPTALIDACDSFYGNIKDYYTLTGQIVSLTAEEFAELTPALLAVVTPGGQVVRDNNGSVAEPTPVILWYKDAVCYYYYEIHHDIDVTANMAFGKYGVVRNNWYNLTLNSVSGPGTPWYPEINNPGPGDPDPNDPIDKQAGYLGISVSIADWIFRDTGFVI